MSDDEELTNLQRGVTSDILSAPVPSNVPSPALMPSAQRPSSSLIQFDSLASIHGATYTDIFSISSAKISIKGEPRHNGCEFSSPV